MRGGADFGDSKWPVIELKDFTARRSGGHIAFPAGPPTKRDAPLFSRPGAGGHGCYRPLSCLACTLIA
jgi:hypothetical protein